MFGKTFRGVPDGSPRVFRGARPMDFKLFTGSLSDSPTPSSTYVSNNIPWRTSHVFTSFPWMPGRISQSIAWGTVVESSGLHGLMFGPSIQSFPYVAHSIPRKATHVFNNFPRRPGRISQSIPWGRSLDLQGLTGSFSNTPYQALPTSPIASHGKLHICSTTFRGGPGGSPRCLLWMTRSIFGWMGVGCRVGGIGCQVGGMGD